jgi:thiol:disulfide interchange protein DsbC
MKLKESSSRVVQGLFKSSSIVVQVLLVLLVMSIGAVQAASDAKSLETIKAEFDSIFPGRQAEKVTETPVPGVYEVELKGGGIVYYLGSTGESKYVFAGRLLQITKNNLVDLTEQSISRKAVERLKDYKQYAVKIGSGPVEVYEFIDPDCPFCRRVHQFLEQNEQKVTRYVFLFPLTQLHPQAEQKSLEILSKGISNGAVKHDAPEIAQAYKEALSGKWDKDWTPNLSKDSPEYTVARRLLDKHIEAGEGIVRGTPVLVINGKVIHGANMPAIEEALNAKTH